MDTEIDIIHNELNIPKLRERRLIHLAIDCNSSIHNIEAGLNKFFRPIDETRVRTTRITQTNVMNVENNRSVHVRRAYSFRGPNFWNSIDNNRLLINRSSKVISQNYYAEM